MQKVVGSSPIIRFTKAPLDGVFCCLFLRRGRTVRRSPIAAHSIAGRTLLGAVSPSGPTLRCLARRADREPGVLVAELIGGEAHVVAAGAAETRERPSHTSPIYVRMEDTSQARRSSRSFRG